MEDEELKAIRAARLQELRQNSGHNGNSSNGQSGSNGSNQNDAAQMMMTQLLEPEAKERLARVKLVKPERADAVMKYLMQLYQSGAIRRKVNEDQIVDILEKVASDERKQNDTEIVFDRRDKSGEGDIEDDDFFD